MAEGHEETKFPLKPLIGVITGWNTTGTAEPILDLVSHMTGVEKDNLQGNVLSECASVCANSLVKKHPLLQNIAGQFEEFFKRVVEGPLSQQKSTVVGMVNEWFSLVEKELPENLRAGFPVEKLYSEREPEKPSPKSGIVKLILVKQW